MHDKENSKMMKNQQIYVQTFKNMTMTEGTPGDMQGEIEEDNQQKDSPPKKKHLESYQHKETNIHHRRVLNARERSIMIQHVDAEIPLEKFGKDVRRGMLHTW